MVEHYLAKVVMRVRFSYFAPLVKCPSGVKAAAGDLKSPGRKTVPVQVWPRVPDYNAPVAQFGRA